MQFTRKMSSVFKKKLHLLNRADSSEVLLKGKLRGWGVAQRHSACRASVRSASQTGKPGRVAVLAIIAVKADLEIYLL